MLCVAPFSEDKMLYRAQVVRLPGRREVHVRYVDFGNVEIKPYWELKAIPSQFCKLPAIVSICITFKFPFLALNILGTIKNSL